MGCFSEAIAHSVDPMQVLRSVKARGSSVRGSHCFRQQLVVGAEPIFIRRSLRATPGLPELVRQIFYAAVVHRRLCMSVFEESLLRVLQRLAGMLLARQVILPIMMFGGDTVRVRG